MAKEFNDVQLDVDFTQASLRTNLTNKENISLAFGKLSKWYEALVPTGGSSGQFLAWNSSGTAKWVSNPNTDTKVRQSILSTDTNHPLLLAYSDNTITTANVDNVSYRSNGIYANPSTGTVTAINFAGKINGHTVSIDVPSDAKFTDTVYTHPTYTSKTSGLYKITVDGTGHVSATAAVTASDLPTHTHDNYLGAVKIGNFWGMAYPDGTDTGTSWIRTTRSGIIPYAINTDETDGNSSSLGTATWTFRNGFINNIYYKDLKSITVVAGSEADNGIDSMSGSFFFSGNHLIGDVNDWVGVQAGYSNDKWQLIGTGSRLLYRQNDMGDADVAGWTDWRCLINPNDIVGNSGITVTKQTTSFGSGDAAQYIDTGVNIGHTNSVTAQTNFNKSYVKYDTEGHITESDYFVHTAAGTGGVTGWVKIATMKHLQTYDDTPIELTLSQRGNHLTYRLHILFKSVNSLDPDIDKFVISMDTTDDTAIRAYIIKSATSTWDLYILKRGNYEAIVVSEFNVGKYFPDRMEWTWKDEQTAASVITGGTEATKQCYGSFLQSNTATKNYKPIVMGTTSTNDTTKLNTTITGQGYVSNLIFSKPDTGYLYASAISTSSYLNNTGAQLARYGLYLKSYLKRADNTEYSYARYGIRTYDGKSSESAGMLLTIDSGGLTIIGGGEAAKALADLIDDDQSINDAAKLDLGGTLNTSLTGSSEQLILASDGPISFLTNCNTIENRKPVLLDTVSQFYPGTTLTGSIGTSTYYWNNAYFNNLYLSSQSLLTRSSGSTFYRATRSDTDISISFGVGNGGINHGIYSYGLGSWMIFGNATDVYLMSTLHNPSTETALCAIPFFGAAPSTGTKAVYNNDGLRYSTREGTTSQPGIARLVVGNSVASNSDANKEGIVRIYSVENGYVDLSSESSTVANTLTFPALTGTLRIQRNALQYDSNSDFASYSWHKFAETTSTITNDDRYITFLVSRTFRGNVIGILTVHLRTGTTKVFSSAEFEWILANDDIIPSNFVMVYIDTADTSCKVELWYKQEARYDGWLFEVLKENTRLVTNQNVWTLYSSSGHGSATYTAGTGTVISTLGKIKNAPGIYNVIGTQTASTSVWTGSIDVSALYDGLTIAYYLPYASTSTAVTLNLTLADGTTTGAINCYVNNNSRLTTHYGAGSTIILTYWSAGSIKVSGTATTDNRWSRCEQNTNTNVTQNLASGNTKRPLLMSYYTVGNTGTSANVTYRNDAVYVNPSRGAIHAKNLVLGSAYSVDTPGVKGMITLHQTASETLPAANIEAATGIAGHADSTIKIPTDRSGVVRLEEILYSVTEPPASGMTISNLTFSYGTPRYLKVSARIGSTFTNGVTNIFDIGLNTDSGSGVIFTWGTPGQSGVTTYIQYANVRITSLNDKYTISFVTGSAMRLTAGGSPSAVTSPNMFIYEVIAVY